jgi:D-alanyl-D-alanine carboxypeptidase
MSNKVRLLIEMVLRQKIKKISIYTAVIVLGVFVISDFFRLQGGDVPGIHSILGGNTVSFSRTNTPVSTALQGIPIFLNATYPPALNAEAAIVIDRQSYTPLYNKNSNIRTYPASTTKIASAIVVMEQYALDELITVPNDIYSVVNGSSMKLTPGDVLRVNDLLWGMLISSGNDAAYTLALAHPKGMEGFIEDMNELTIRLNLKDTSFADPVGFDYSNQFSSPLDLAVLADRALDFPLIREIVETKDAVVTSAVNPKIEYKLHNTNLLLGKVAGVRGVKTGWTDAAQGVLVTDVERNGHEVIVVVMRSNQRELDTTKIIEWVYQNYKW